MVSFEIFVKAMPPSLSELKVLPSFCFAFKIPDNVAASNVLHILIRLRCESLTMKERLKSSSQSSCDVIAEDQKNPGIVLVFFFDNFDGKVQLF